MMAKLKSADMCVGFALKFKDVFNEDYVVNWKQTVKQ